MIFYDYFGASVYRYEGQIRKTQPIGLRIVWKSVSRSLPPQKLKKSLIFLKLEFKQFEHFILKHTKFFLKCKKSERGDRILRTEEAKAPSPQKIFEH